MWLAGNIEPSIKQCLKCLNDGAMLTDRNLPEALVISMQGESVSLLEAKLQFRQFLTTPYTADLTRSPAVTPEKVATIYEVARALDGESDCDLAALKWGPDSNDRASIHGDYGGLREVCAVFNESVPSLLAGLLSLTIRNEVAISSSSTLEAGSGALESTLSSNSIYIGKLESQHELHFSASKVYIDLQMSPTQMM